MQLIFYDPKNDKIEEVLQGERHEFFGVDDIMFTRHREKIRIHTTVFKNCVIISPHNDIKSIGIKRRVK